MVDHVDPRTGQEFSIAGRERYLEKSLPSNEESERIILGAVLLDNSVIAQAVEHLKPGDFYSPRNRRVFTAMVALFEKSKQIDPILIGEELKKEGSLESMGGISTITNLTFGLPHFSNVEEYIKVVKDKATLRDLIRTCNAITSEALAEEDTAQNILDKAEHLIYTLYDRGNTAAASLMTKAVTEAIESAKARAESGEVVIGISTGFRDLDMKLQGFRRKQYVLIAARPSVGKTSLATRMLMKCVMETKEPVLFFSLEMAKEEIAERVICAEAGIDSYMFRAGHLTEREWAESVRVQTRLSESADFYINDTPSINTRFMRAEIRRVQSLLRKQGKRLGLVVMDHTGLASNNDDKRGRTREGEVADISKDLKAIAREENLTTIALVQLNRQPENRADHRPMISDLRESGGLEQDADVAMLLFREDVYQSDPQLYNNIAEVIIGKNRNGPTGSVKLYFTRKSTRFSDLSEAADNRPPEYQQGDFEL